MTKSVLNTRNVGPSCGSSLDTVIDIALKKLPKRHTQIFGNKLKRCFGWYKNYILRSKKKYYTTVPPNQKPPYLLSNESNVFLYAEKPLWERLGMFNDLINHYEMGRIILLYTGFILRIMANVGLDCSKRNEAYKALRVVRASSYYNKSKSVPKYFTNNLRKYHKRLDKWKMITKDAWKYCKSYDLYRERFEVPYDPRVYN